MTELCRFNVRQAWCEAEVATYHSQMMTFGKTTLQHYPPFEIVFTLDYMVQLEPDEGNMRFILKNNHNDHIVIGQLSKDVIKNGKMPKYVFDTEMNSAIMGVLRLSQLEVAPHDA